MEFVQSYFEHLVSSLGPQLGFGRLKWGVMKQETAGGAWGGCCECAIETWRCGLINFLEADNSSSISINLCTKLD